MAGIADLLRAQCRDVTGGSPPSSKAPRVMLA